MRNGEESSDARLRSIPTVCSNGGLNQIGQGRHGDIRMALPICRRRYGLKLIGGLIPSPAPQEKEP